MLYKAYVNDYYYDKNREQHDAFIINQFNFDERFVFAK